jgi:hypothetical protein
MPEVRQALVEKNRPWYTVGTAMGDGTINKEIDKNLASLNSDPVSAFKSLVESPETYAVLNKYRDKITKTTGVDPFNTVNNVASKLIANNVSPKIPKEANGIVTVRDFRSLGSKDPSKVQPVVDNNDKSNDKPSGNSILNFIQGNPWKAASLASGLIAMGSGHFGLGIIGLLLGMFGDQIGQMLYDATGLDLGGIKQKAKEIVNPEGAKADADARAAAAKAEAEAKATAKARNEADADSARKNVDNINNEAYLREGVPSPADGSPEANAMRNRNALNTGISRAGDAITNTGKSIKAFIDKYVPPPTPTAPAVPTPPPPGAPGTPDRPPLNTPPISQAPVPNTNDAIAKMDPGRPQPQPLTTTDGPPTPPEPPVANAVLPSKSLAPLGQGPVADASGKSATGAVPAPSKGPATPKLPTNPLANTATALGPGKIPG